MKINLTIISLVAIFFITGCKKNDFEGIDAIKKTEDLGTFKSQYFEAPLQFEKQITQQDEANIVTRYLIPYKKVENEKVYKYSLIEQNNYTKQTTETKIIAKGIIENNVNLFAIPIKQDIIQYFDVKQNSIAKGKIVFKHANKEIDINSNLKVGLNNDLQKENAVLLYCIVTYWEYTDNNGNVIGIEIISETCYFDDGAPPIILPPISGGGGGTGGPPVENNCDNLVSTLVDGTHVSDQLRSISTISATSIERKRKYQWIPLVNYGGWGLLSTEIGVHKKVANSDPTLRWQWKDFIHTNLVKEGVTLGGTVDFTCVAYKTLGLYNAVMNLDIHVNYNVACFTPLPIEKNYPASKMFNVDGGPEVVD
jgi:hypothetical protein